MGLLNRRFSDSQTKSTAVSAETLVRVNTTLRKVEADALSIPQLIPAILELTSTELPASALLMLLFDEKRRVTHAWHLRVGKPAQPRGEATGRLLSSGLERWVAEHGEASIVSNTLTDERWTGRSDSPFSVVCAPLKRQDSIIGTLTVQTRGTNQYSQRDLELIAAIASDATSTVINAQRHDESKRQIQALGLLNEASHALISSLKIEEIMQSLLAKTNELLNAQAVSIALIDQSTDELVYRVAEGEASGSMVGIRFPASQGVTGWVLNHGEPVLISDTSRDTRFDRRGDARTGILTRAIICAPLTSKSRILGTIQAVNPVDTTFTEQDLDLLVSLANLAATALANANLYAASQEAESRYTGLFEDNIDPIIISEMSGEIIAVNRKAIEFLGYSRDEMKDKRVTDLHIGEYNSVLSTRSKGVLIFTSDVLCSDGTTVPVEVHAKNILFGDREVIQWIERDITEQVELEQLRRDLTAMLIHDMQSPVGNIMSSLEIAEMELPEGSDPAIRSFLSIASDSSKLLRDLIRSLLDIDRLEAGHSITDRGSAHVADLIASAKRLVSSTLERRNVSVEANVPANLPPIHVDVDMIRRVVLNLLDNSLKYTPINSTVTIDVSYLDNGKTLTVSVSDQGSGIPIAYRRTIFDKFRRIKEENAPKGLGLGLAFCRLAIEAHGGRIWVDAADGGGARFNFTLPVQSGGY